MELYKYYVDVITYISRDGDLTPLVIIWRERKYKIDKVRSIRETYSQAGGCGVCYECQLGRQIRNLFWERSRWFIESRIYIPIDTS